MLNECYIPNREWYWLNILNFALDLSTLTPKKWHTYIKSMVSHHTKSKQIYSILPSLTMLKYGTYFVFSSSFHSTPEINTKWKFGLFNSDFFSHFGTHFVKTWEYLQWMWCEQNRFMFADQIEIERNAWIIKAKCFVPLPKCS